MRERLTELLPLFLVGVVLVAWLLLSRDDWLRAGIPFLPLQEQPAATPTPRPAARATATPRARASVVASPTPAAGSCTASAPTFLGGIAELKADLGAVMGEAAECERSVDDQGNTQQTTTTGLAYYRRHLNVACFTTGWDHWARRPAGLVHWTGDAVDPPPD